MGRVKLSAAKAGRASACDGKAAYDTAEAAGAAMLSFKRRKAPVQRFNVYRCRFCRKFHWGSGDRTGSARGLRIVDAIDRALAEDEARRAAHGASADRKTE